MPEFSWSRSSGLGVTTSNVPVTAIDFNFDIFHPLVLLIFLVRLLYDVINAAIPADGKSKGISDLLSARIPTSSSYHCVWLASQELHVCLEVEVPQHLSLFVFNHLSCCLPAF